MTRRRVSAGLIAGTLLLAACGGGDEGVDGGADAARPQVEDSGDAASTRGISTVVDLAGTEVLPESDFDGNLLPSVIVDDINTGRKVNFRNLVPQEKPILLWMWAPH